MRPARALVLSLVALVGTACNKGDGLVYVELTAASPIERVAALHVTMSVGSTERTHDITSLPDNVVDDSARINFGIDVSATYGSSIRVDVEARDGLGATLATGSGTGSITPGKSSTITVSLQAVAATGTDGGTPDDLGGALDLSGGSDLSGSFDLSMPRDLAAPRDLELPPDLSQGATCTGATGTFCPASPGAGDLQAIWGFAANDIWTVGGPGAIYHFDGNQWTKFTAPPSAASAYLESVWGGATNDVWASGGNSGGVLIHWDGSAWSDTIASNTSENLYGISGSATNDVWIGTSGGNLMHWNGSAWSKFTTPNSSIGNDGIMGTFAISTSNAWAAQQNELVQWGGTSWANKQALGAGNGTLWSVHGVSASDIWAGTAGNQGGHLLHFDGSTWTDVATVASMSQYGINNLFARTSSDVWAAASSVLMHYNGSSWQVAASIKAGQNITAVWASSASDVWFTSLGSPNLYHATP